MEKIIDPVDKDLLKAELTADKKLMDTNRGGNEIYIVTWHDAPNVVTEIGRLREEAFRQAGGSTGLACDLDEYDKMAKPYKQLIIWDPEECAIIGGYRYILGPDVEFEDNGQPILASAHQFHFSDEFIKAYLPHVMELGRSFVAPEYQSSKAGAKAIFTLDNLWDGITSVIYDHPSIQFFFGKVTMYPDFDYISRDLILHYLNKYFGDKDSLVTPIGPLEIKSDPGLMDIILRGKNMEEDYKLLKDAVRLRNTNIPPLVNSYMNTTPKMLVFGTADNPLMKHINDTGILIAFDDIYDDKKRRHVESFRKHKLARMKARFPLIDPEMETKIVQGWGSRRARFAARIMDAIKSRTSKRK